MLMTFGHSGSRKLHTLLPMGCGNVTVHVRHYVGHGIRPAA